ncbi:hypothetical protein O181_095706 [Austropuccinia psidii MF-1]|uniref:Translation machinery-associated protein 20 n=1 Tax=Austropuccinia psidii MF-1 TaxID=1389203 RepID=A0A9Q3J600_9BASI|nr:hypothetical protein [Austropuccinia psidii MF-1]
MFKKFIPKEDIASNSIIKSSTQRLIRNKLIEQIPNLNLNLNLNLNSLNQVVQVQDQDDNNNQLINILEIIWPKKEPLYLIKCRDHVSILACDGVPLFYQHFDGPYFPTLKLLHQYPILLPRVQVDRGAIKFVLAGANIMCPGLTSPGACLPVSLPAKTPVAVHAEGKEHACAVGLTQLSTEDMQKINKGIGVDNVHWLGDDLWSIEKL